MVDVPRETADPREAEAVARVAAEQLGYLAVVGVACGAREGEATARCTVRVRDESAQHVEGETDLVTLAWICNASGCWSE